MTTDLIKNLISLSDADLKPLARKLRDLAANQKVTQLAALTTIVSDDLLLAVDVNDTSMAPSGTDKNLTRNNLFASYALNSINALVNSAATTQYGAFTTLASAIAAARNNILITSNATVGGAINITQDTTIYLASGFGLPDCTGFVLSNNAKLTLIGASSATCVVDMFNGVNTPFIRGTGVFVTDGISYFSVGGGSNNPFSASTVEVHIGHDFQYSDSGTSNNGVNLQCPGSTVGNITITATANTSSNVFVVGSRCSAGDVTIINAGPSTNSLVNIARGGHVNSILGSSGSAPVPNVVAISLSGYLGGVFNDVNTSPVIVINNYGTLVNSTITSGSAFGVPAGSVIFTGDYGRSLNNVFNVGLTVAISATQTAITDSVGNGAYADNSATTQATGNSGSITNTSGSAVDSVFGRTGVVTATAADYTAAQITNVPTGIITETEAQGALDELATLLSPLLTAYTYSVEGLYNGVADTITWQKGYPFTMTKVGTGNYALAWTTNQLSDNYLPIVTATTDDPFTALQRLIATDVTASGFSFQLANSTQTLLVDAQTIYISVSYRPT